MSTIDDIKQRLDIVDVASSYIKLQKAGRNFKALCPFHQEKTPSFFIFPERQSWRCFGCGAGGDLFSFVMKKEGLDFGETLKLLANKAGVSLERKKETSESKLTERLYQINEAAAQYYHELLLHSPAAEGARDYAMKKRGLTPKTIDDFQLGFCAGEGLKKHLLEQGYLEKELLSLRLLGEKDGRTYDFFRHRLMFPIRDTKSRVVGFGGRALDDSMPKYLNSPQTAIFDKSSILYGIDRAKGAIREKKLAVIVEGYMDVITAHQHGFTNVVGSMGTALTDKQLNMLKGLTRNLAFALDPDTAGDAATLRAIETARRSLDREDLEMVTWLGGTSKLKAEIKIISMPQGKDPDVVIREDPQSWQQLVDHALPLMEHLLTMTTSRFDLTKPEEKSRASEQLLPMIIELDDDVQREFYLSKLSNLLGVSDKTLRGIAARLSRTRSEKVTKAEPTPSTSTSFGDPVEEQCLCLLLKHPELRDKAKGLSPEHFEHSENREIFIVWRNTSDLDMLLSTIEPDLREHLDVLLKRTIPPASESDIEKMLAICVCRLKERRLKLQQEFLTHEGVAVISSMIDKDKDVDSATLAQILKETVEVDADLIKEMERKINQSFHREEQ